MKQETFHVFAKTLACLAVLWQNFHYMQTEPFMDAINGAITGLVIYAIWFARERTK